MNKDYIRKIVFLALQEDVGKGDVTTNALVLPYQRSKARLVSKSSGILCGNDFARQAFAQLDPQVRFQCLVRDGKNVKPGMVIAQVQGLARALLTGERVAINFLSYLSSIATKTHAFVKEVKPYKSIIMDTRKTTPLLRELERYAVCCGGGVNHRFNLNAMAMVKDNHRFFCSKQRNISQMVAQVKRQNKKPVELEVDTLEQFQEALASKADIILLDNMTPSQTRRAVALRDQSGSKTLLEASGGIDINNVRRYAASGVERISVGRLTHSREALDISLEFYNDQ